MKTVPVSITVMRRTEKAMLVKLNDLAEREEWIPLSVIEDDDGDINDLVEGEIAEINVAEWFYERELEP